MKRSVYQVEVDKWVSQYKIGYWRPHEILARITEETGELARIINHIYGPKKKKPTESKQDIGEEMADIIFAVACLANSLDINLDEEFEKVMNKAYGRDKNRFEKNNAFYASFYREA